jgi:putative membrane protein
MYLYLKAIHIIFVVTWFAGLFYMPRLLIYNTEANDKSPEARTILREQFTTMLRRLWYGITWPSAIITLIIGLATWDKIGYTPQWLVIKLGFVVALYAYHISLHLLFRQQVRGIFRYSSQQLRLWNEVATIFLVAIVMLAIVKKEMSLLWGLSSLVGLILLLMLAINIYKKMRKG